MAPRDWRNAADYADLAGADLSTLAWEFLRRNPLYRLQYAGLALAASDEALFAARWGLRFPASPSLDAGQAPVFWTPDVAPAHALVLVRADAAGVTGEVLQEGSHGRRVAEEGVHLRFADGLQLLIPAELGPRTPLAAAAALDAVLAVRITALGALERHLAGRATSSSPLPPLSRRRSVLMLRALDGRALGASYRDVAQHLLGGAADAVAWRTSAVRDVAIRLCRSARRMMGGGYLGLLRRRR